MSRFDPLHMSADERRRLMLGKWLARAALLAAVVFAVAVSFPDLMQQVMP